jgi:hypothetical protein
LFANKLVKFANAAAIPGFKMPPELVQGAISAFVSLDCSPCSSPGIPTDLEMDMEMDGGGSVRELEYGDF